MDLNTYLEKLNEVESILNHYLCDQTDDDFSESKVDDVRGALQDYIELWDGEHSNISTDPLNLIYRGLHHIANEGDFDSSIGENEGFNMDDVRIALGMMDVLRRVVPFTLDDVDNIDEALEEYTQEARKPEGVDSVLNYEGSEGYVLASKAASIKINNMRKNMA